MPKRTSLERQVAEFNTGLPQLKRLVQEWMEENTQDDVKDEEEEVRTFDQSAVRATSRKAARKAHRQAKKLARRRRFSRHDDQASPTDTQAIEGAKPKKKKKKKKKSKQSDNAGNEAFMQMLQEQGLDGSSAHDEDDLMIEQMEKRLGLKKKGNGASVLGADLDFVLGYKDDVETAEDLPDDADDMNDFLDNFEPGSKDDASDGENDVVYDSDDAIQQQEDFGEDGDDLVDDDKEDDGDDMDLDNDPDFAALNRSLHFNGNTEENGASEIDQTGVSYISRSNVYGDNVVPSMSKEAADALLQQQQQAHGDDISGGDNLAASKGRYLPPALRKLKAATHDPVAKLAKGLLNRVNEDNLSKIVKELEALFQRNSRNKMSQVLTDFVIEACIRSDKMSTHLLQVYTAVVACLHCIVGMEVSAFFLQEVATKLDVLRNKQLQDLEAAQEGTETDIINAIMDKQCANLCSLVALLYQYKVVHSDLVCDLLTKFIASFTAVDIELILELLKMAGVKLRRDDPLKLKEVLDSVKTQAAQQEKQSSRVSFMLESIEDLRSNRCKLLKDVTAQLEPLIKAIRATVRGRGGSSEPLRVPLQDLLDAKTRGRWWLVGAAWTGRAQDKTTPGSSLLASTRHTALPSSSESSTNSNLLKLASQQRMNTDVRRKVFVTVMDSEDYVDAADKLLRLKFKGKQEREVVRVVLDCAVQSKVYNAFYSFTLSKLCEFSHNHKITLQYAFWDRFKQLGDMKLKPVTILMRVLAHCIIHEATSLSCLKTLEFTSLPQDYVFPLQYFFAHLLTAFDEEPIIAAFKRLASNDNVSTLKDSILLFLKMYCRDSTAGIKIKGSNEEKLDLVRSRIKLVKRILSHARS
eukprot:TRINITY_DN12113_c0_g1_i5.p1 TRINITY_DN12113_c0_g1~~TRINITY_DN12113_c0_g1_i5.p1  ORF type:complete len:863 (+),score=230.27 TRINITY_DN12113_c0_g1_i5:119-2707(+)